MAKVEIAASFTDQMILQREMHVPVWGKATTGKTLTVTFAGQTMRATADSDGRWQVVLDPMQASAAGRTLTVDGDGRVQLTGVLVGEVWLASGQSNMQYAMSQTDDGKAALPQATHPLIRIYQRPVGKRGREEWMSCTPETAEDLSAVAYFYARHLRKELDVPIGLIVRAVGGTTIQSWVAPESITHNVLIQKNLAEAARRKAEFPRYEVEKTKYDKRNPPTREVQHFLAEMSQLTYYRGTGIGGLYNRMIKPLQPFAIRGVIWYQGEFNNRLGQAYDYREWQACLADGWRKAWGQGEFPFLFVQMQVLGNPTTALLRESQATTLDRCPNTAMAVICDQSVGLHPPTKQVAGDRLAIAARSLVYGEEHPPMGPRLKAHRCFDRECVLTFDNVGEGLIAKGEKLRGFFVAGSDAAFHVAQAKIIGKDQISISCDAVAQPVAVRYAWLNDPRQEMTLFNSVDLPASPFRTDTFSDARSLDHLVANVKTKEKPKQRVRRSERKHRRPRLQRCWGARSSLYHHAEPRPAPRAIRTVNRFSCTSDVRADTGSVDDGSQSD